MTEFRILSMQTFYMHHRDERFNHCFRIFLGHGDVRLSSEEQTWTNCWNIQGKPAAAAEQFLEIFMQSGTTWIEPVLSWSGGVFLKLQLTSGDINLSSD